MLQPEQLPKKGREGKALLHDECDHQGCAQRPAAVSQLIDARNANLFNYKVSVSLCELGGRGETNTQSVKLFLLVYCLFLRTEFELFTTCLSLSQEDANFGVAQWRRRAAAWPGAWVAPSPKIQRARWWTWPPSPAHGLSTLSPRSSMSAPGGCCRSPRTSATPS